MSSFHHPKIFQTQQFMAKPIQYCKVKLINFKKLKNKKTPNLINYLPD